MGSMSVRLKQQLHQGILRMLSTVQTQAVQVNGLGEFYFCPVDGKYVSKTETAAPSGYTQNVVYSTDTGGAG